MKMYLSGQWRESPSMTTLRAPYSGEPIGEVPEATDEQIEQALAAAEDGAVAMANLTAYERNEILMRAADLATRDQEDLARTISLEEGKPIAEARLEAGRIPDLIRLCSFEGSQIRGETLPIDAQVGSKGKMGFTLRVPCGIVVAIAPFNFPLLLVLHKVGPALAAGNAVIVKPAHQTPFTALKLTKIFLDAGIPENALQCITGNGSRLGPALCSDPRPRNISFTGSAAVGEAITKVAGVKKLSLELGANCPVVVLPDADLEQVAQATAVGGYANAGQVCISVQRILVDRGVYGDFVDCLKGPVEAIKVGDPMEEDTKLGAMVSQHEAERVEAWVDEAVAGGARMVTGGQRDGAVYAPTIVTDVDPKMRISCKEVFGPVVAVTPVDSVDDAIRLANDSDYGLGAGVFTRDINAAWRFIREVHTGNVMINWTPLYRADLQPYGGFKQSGIGKEGPKYAVEEMTEIKTVVFHGLGS